MKMPTPITRDAGGGADDRAGALVQEVEDHGEPAAEDHAEHDERQASHELALAFFQAFGFSGGLSRHSGQ